VTLEYLPPDDGARAPAREAGVEAGPTNVRGAAPETVREAVETGNSFPGVAGFAGRVEDRLVRDVLGRQPLFVDPGAENWSFGPAPLADPHPFPAGAMAIAGGTADPDDGPSLDDPRSVWSVPDREPFEDRETGVSKVREAFEAVRVPDVPVAFSGGVDSSLLAARSDGPLYVAGFPDSHDVESARAAADRLDRDLRVVEVTHESLRDAVLEVAAATGRTNAMDVGIAVPLYLVARSVASDGHDRLLVGQGADELFGGYAKVAKAPEDPRVDADTVRGATGEVIATLPHQLARDVPAIRAAGLEPVAPMLHDRIVETALGLPGELLVEDGRRKVALREVASDWLPEELAERDKKAVQYGSLVARELDRLARQDGFKRRMDDHVTKYVESLVE
jgi:asparagine synthase (glutamine-hydrolysing)